MKLSWKASFSASCLHAAACAHEGLPVGDSTIANALHTPIEGLLAQLTACGLAPGTTLQQLVASAGEVENNRQLVELVVKRTIGAATLSESALARLAGCVADLEAAWLREQPRLVDELAVRGRPLREQWEARGPGLLRSIERLTTEALIAERAEVVLVSPWVGGHGRAHLISNRVTFEAVLTHPHPTLPETLRLGWLLAQLQLDLPVLSETVPGSRLPRLASLATLPLVLAAAEEVELATLDLTTLQQTLSCWLPALPQTGELPQQLLDWWQAYASSETRWPVAIAALDAMVNESEK